MPVIGGQNPTVNVTVPVPTPAVQEKPAAQPVPKNPQSKLQAPPQGLAPQQPATLPPPTPTSIIFPWTPTDKPKKKLPRKSLRMARRVLRPGEIDQKTGGKYEPKAEPELNEFIANQFKENYGERSHGISYSTGFLTPEGEGIPMGPEQRYEDHRAALPSSAAMKRWGWNPEVVRANEQGGRTTALFEMMRRSGAARIHASNGNLIVHLASVPTGNQKRAIVQHVRDYNPKSVIISHVDGAEHDLSMPRPHEVMHALENPTGDSEEPERYAAGDDSPKMKCYYCGSTDTHGARTDGTANASCSDCGKLFSYDHETGESKPRRERKRYSADDLSMDFDSMGEDELPKQPLQRPVSAEDITGRTRKQILQQMLEASKKGNYDPAGMTPRDYIAEMENKQDDVPQFGGDVYLSDPEDEEPEKFTRLVYPKRMARAADESAFHKAINDNPNDSTPRRMYADYLEEIGHPQSVIDTLRNSIGPVWIGKSPKGVTNAIPYASKEVMGAPSKGGWPGYPAHTQLYHVSSRNSKGQAHGVRVSGKMQTWKTRSNEFRIPWKFGLYQNGEINHNNFRDWLVDDPTQEPT